METWFRAKAGESWFESPLRRELGAYAVPSCDSALEDAFEAPVYELVSVCDPDHSRDFECKVTHDRIELGQGKKAAEAQAALAALEMLGCASYPLAQVGSKPSTLVQIV